MWSETTANYAFTHHIRGGEKSERLCVNRVKTNRLSPFTLLPSPPSPGPQRERGVGGGSILSCHAACRQTDQLVGFRQPDLRRHSPTLSTYTTCIPSTCVSLDFAATVRGITTTVEETNIRNSRRRPAECKFTEMSVFAFSWS